MSYDLCIWHDPNLTIFFCSFGNLISFGFNFQNLLFFHMNHFFLLLLLTINQSIDDSLTINDEKWLGKKFFAWKELACKCDGQGKWFVWFFLSEMMFPSFLMCPSRERRLNFPNNHHIAFVDNWCVFLDLTVENVKKTKKENEKSINQSNLLNKDYICQKLNK